MTAMTAPPPPHGSRAGTKRNPLLEELLIEGLSTGAMLTVLCRDYDVGVRTVYDWISSDPEFAERMEAARKAGYEAIAQETLAIADDLDEHPNSRRVRIETRLKLLAKWHPKRYGDKLEVETRNASVTAAIAPNATAEEAAQVYAELMKTLD